MWGDQPVFPTISASPSTISGGLTYKHLTAMLILSGMYMNPQLAALSKEELAQKAKDAADTLIGML